LHVGAITLRATQPVSAERRAVVEQAWSEAQRRFSTRHATAPEIVFAPSTELFRQMTAQPGWELASTRGNAIVIQPDRVLRTNASDDSTLLLHEMLHVLVEAEAGARTPLWLREGLVEVLASESGRGVTGNSMPLGAIETALIHADSVRASQRAHFAAAAVVRRMVDRYGVSTVRGWLSSGVPAGVE
jgi:stage II sporulation protein D